MTRRRVVLVYLAVVAAWLLSPPPDTSAQAKRMRFVVAAPAGGGGGSVDLSEYRVTTYGPVDHYCSATRSLASAGTGTSGDPWNLDQCQSQPVCGDVIGVQAIGANTPVDLPAPNDSDEPAFDPDGVTDCTSGAPLVYVAQWAAISMVNVTTPSSSSVITSQLRTELRHAGTADSLDVVGTGGKVYGSNDHNYITYDGFYIDMAEAQIREDSGVFGSQNATGVRFLNFAIKGTTTDVDSNAIIYRPENAVDTVVSNFALWDYNNNPLGGGLNQAGLFSDQYGDQNCTIEHGLIDGADMGIFLKGTSVGGTVFNYCTLRYNIIRNVQNCFRFNDLHSTELTTVAHNLCHSIISDDSSAEALAFDSITTAGRNILIEFNTFAKIDASDPNSTGGLIVTDLGLGASASNNVTIRHNLVDVNNGTQSHQVLLLTTLPQVMNYNAYYKNGATESYVFNGTQHNTFAAWQAAISGRDANSLELSSSPFVDRTNNDFHISGGHAAKTLASDGGEVGAYGGGLTETLGPITS